MKKHILGLLFLSVTGTCLTSCGDDFLDTKNYSGVDVDNGLTDASSVSNAVNGEYDWFYHYYFAGDFATMIGDNSYRLVILEWFYKSYGCHLFLYDDR